MLLYRYKDQHQQISRMSKSISWVTFISLASILLVISNNCPPTKGQANNRRPSNGNRNRVTEKQAILKDAFYEDNGFVVRIKTTFNQTYSITCNGVVMDEQLVLSDVSCIKYQNMAYIDAKFVSVLVGEVNNETAYDVEHIYINKADPKDASTELALLKLYRPLMVDAQCRQLIKPEKNISYPNEANVRVIGYTINNELKENRRIAAQIPNQNPKHICTTPSELNETPGSFMLKGAPLLYMVDCRQYQLIGIFGRVDTISSLGQKKHQDCYVSVSSQMRWFEKVKSIATLSAKTDVNSTMSSVSVISVEDE